MSSARRQSCLLGRSHNPHHHRSRDINPSLSFSRTTPIHTTRRIWRQMHRADYALDIAKIVSPRYLCCWTGNCSCYKLWGRMRYFSHPSHPLHLAFILVKANLKTDPPPSSSPLHEQANGPRRPCGCSLDPRRSIHSVYSHERRLREPCYRASVGSRCPRDG